MEKEPKFKLGEKVWVIRNQKAVQYIIVGLMLDKKGTVQYCTSEGLPRDWSNSVYCDEKEHTLFKTKEELIASL